MKRLFALVLLATVLNPAQVVHASFLSKIPRILRAVPLKEAGLRTALNSTLEQSRTRLDSFRMSPDSQRLSIQRYARIGLETMSTEALQNQLKSHRVFEKNESWVSDVSSKLTVPKEKQMRCAGCIGNCPRGVACFEPPVSMKIRNILSVIPADEASLRKDLTEILTRYKEHARGLSSNDSRETQTMATTYAQVGLDKEVSEEVGERLKQDLSKKEEPWQEEVLKILNEQE